MTLVDPRSRLAPTVANNAIAMVGNPHGWAYSPRAMDDARRGSLSEHLYSTHCPHCGAPPLHNCISATSGRSITIHAARTLLVGTSGGRVA